MTTAVIGRWGLIYRGDRGPHHVKCVVCALWAVWLESPECVWISGTCSLTCTALQMIVTLSWLRSFGLWERVVGIREKRGVGNCIVTHWENGRALCFICITTDLWFYFSPEEIVLLGRLSAPRKTKLKTFLFKLTLKVWWEWVLFDWERADRLVGRSADAGVWAGE